MLGMPRMRTMRSFHKLDATLVTDERTHTLHTPGSLLSETCQVDVMLRFMC
jgi:hypothetical protein